LTTEEDVSALRFNEEILSNSIDWQTLQKYSESMQNNALLDRISVFTNYYNK
jgi:hypothetical protein